MTAPQNKPDNPDSYALDDTLAGRIAQAAGVGILTALPDYLKSKVGLTVGYLTGFTAFGSLVAFANAQNEDERDDAPLTVEPTSPLKTYGAFLVILALLAVGAFLNVTIARGIVSFLRKRGATKPWSLTGALLAALTFAVSEAEARGLDKQSFNDTSR